MKGYSFRSLTDLVLKIFKTRVLAGRGLSGGGDFSEDRTINVVFGNSSNTVTEGTDLRLSNAREWTAPTVSLVEVREGASSERRAFTAVRVRQAIEYWWSLIGASFGKSLLESEDAADGRRRLELFTSSLRWPTWDEVSDKPLVQTTGQSTTDIMSQKAISDAIREVWPVGVCYTQYPHTPTPATLFGGTWKLLFANEGTFFRTEGGGALAFDAGWQGDALRSHSHDASSGQAGGHSHKGTAATAGSHTHSGSTSSAGDHSHSGSTNAAGNHSHTRGTMNITGTFAGYTVWGNSRISGAFTSDNNTYQGPSGTDNRNEGQNTTTLDASRTWTGATSAAGNHSHTLTVNANGDHSHTITAAAGGDHSHTVTTDTANNHVHTITIASTGDTETRPRNRTIRVWQRTA